MKLEPRFAEMMPEVLLAIGPEAFALLAAKALTPKPTPMVSTEHIHSQRVSVREHAAIVSDRLRRVGSSTFRNLCSDCETTLEVIARFLALLELYREGAVAFDQVQALGELHVRWTAGDEDIAVEVDESTPARPPRRRWRSCLSRDRSLSRASRTGQLSSPLRRRQLSRLPRRRRPRWALRRRRLSRGLTYRPP